VLAYFVNVLLAQVEVALGMSTNLLSWLTKDKDWQDQSLSLH